MTLDVLEASLYRALYDDPRGGVFVGKHRKTEKHRADSDDDYVEWPDVDDGQEDEKPSRWFDAENK